RRTVGEYRVEQIDAVVLECAIANGAGAGQAPLDPGIASVNEENHVCGLRETSPDRMRTTPVSVRSCRAPSSSAPTQMPSMSAPSSLIRTGRPAYALRCCHAPRNALKPA